MNRHAGSVCVCVYFFCCILWHVFCAHDVAYITSAYGSNNAQWRAAMYGAFALWRARRYMHTAAITARLLLVFMYACAPLLLRAMPVARFSFG